MDPSDFRRDRPTVIGSRGCLDCRHAQSSSPSRRTSQVPDKSFDTRCPLSPREARLLCVLVASQSVAGFTPSGRLATSIWFHEAGTGSLSLRLASSSSEASSHGSPRDLLGRLHGGRAITMFRTSQRNRLIRLRLTHQKETMGTKYGPEILRLLYCLLFPFARKPA